MSYLRTTLLIAIISLITMSCKDDKAKTSDKTKAEEASEQTTQKVENDNKESTVVCIWKAVSLKETPKHKGKYVTTMYLGESGTTSNEIVIDSLTKTKRTYIKITLADGTSGWIDNRFIAVNAKPHVLTAPSKLYRRPDLVAVSNKDFSEMQYVVVTETKGDWAKVKGKKYTNKWYSEGWIKLNKLTDNQNDIMVALLYEKTKDISTADKKIIALQEIAENTDLSESRWIAEIETEIENIQAKVAEETQEEEIEQGMEMPAQAVDAVKETD